MMGLCADEKWSFRVFFKSTTIVSLLKQRYIESGEESEME